MGKYHKHLQQIVLLSWNSQETTKIKDNILKWNVQ